MSNNYNHYNESEQKVVAKFKRALKKCFNQSINEIATDIKHEVISIHTLPDCDKIEDDDFNYFLNNYYSDDEFDLFSHFDILDEDPQRDKYIYFSKQFSVDEISTMLEVISKSNDDNLGYVDINCDFDPNSINSNEYSNYIKSIFNAFKKRIIFDRCLQKFM